MDGGHHHPAAAAPTAAWAVFPSAAAPDTAKKEAAALVPPAQHYNWSPQRRAELLVWCDRSSASERPRTYDRFYQKTPGNFHLSGGGPGATKPPSSSVVAPEATAAADSAVVSACSSSEEERNAKQQSRRVRRRSKGRRSCDASSSSTSYQSRTVTERDVRHLERHLSMKKTIRKKMMRDLRQAFVDDRAGIVGGGGDPGDLIDQRGLEALNFNGADDDDNGGEDEEEEERRRRRRMFLLDMLRDGGSDDSGLGESDCNAGVGVAGGRKKFHSVRETSSSLARRNAGSWERQEEEMAVATAARAVENVKLEEKAKTIKPEKKSFWQIFGRGKKKN